MHPTPKGVDVTSSGYEVRGRVAIVTLDNPPVNGLGHALRTRLLAAVERAGEDGDVDAVVITGTGRTFSAGADVREFNTPKATAEPTLRTLIAAIEGCAKPVAAAINGTCMGGGLELALGCHFRVAASSAPVALPEVKLGLLPGAGGTQRMPRAVGVETALTMIVSGATTNASDLAKTALFDAVVEGDVVDVAVTIVQQAVAEKLPRKRLREVTLAYPNAEAYFQFARNTVASMAPGFPAPKLCVDAVAAAVRLPFDEGLAFERAQFETLLRTNESRALRHAFFAERQAATLTDVPRSTVARPVERVAVIGAGTMGAGITTAFVAAGLHVTLIESGEQALDRGMANIKGNLEAAAAKGMLGKTSAADVLARVAPSLSLDSARDADLVIEAVFEDFAVKQEVFARLDAIGKPGAILATNTSTLDVDKLAAGTRRPDDVVGMHFFSPAHVMKLLEVVRGERTADDVLVTVMQLAKRIGKTAVVSGVCDGFIGNRMIEHYLRQAMFLVEEGAAPRAVDTALERFGMAMGPFRVSDLAGNDVSWRIRQRRYAERPERAYPRIGDVLCEAGRFGQKTGAGWYRYNTGRREALPDPAVDAMILEYRSDKGIKARKIDATEIVDRCILALVNEGARILEEGIAQRASDIDVIYLAGYGFPRQRGGPMLYADSLGLFSVRRRLRQLAAMPIGDAAFFTPAPLIERLADEGGTFND